MRQVNLSLLLFGLLTGATAQGGCPQWLLGWFSPKSRAVKIDPPPGPSQLAKDYAFLKQLHQVQDPKERNQMRRAYTAPRPKTWLDKSIVLADWALASWFGYRVAVGLSEDPSTLISAALLMPPTLFVADYVTRLFHRWLDLYASEKNLIWGTAAREFRKHHEDPNNLEDADYLSHVSAFGKVMAPFFIATPFIDVSPEWGAAIWVGLVSLLNATEFHKQSHYREPSLFFSILQKLRLAISHDSHMRHHRPPFDQDFGILNGWSNVIPSSNLLTRTFDSIFWKVLGRMPHHWVQDPRSIPPHVVKELTDGLQAIPEELWASADLYPNRMPTELRPSVLAARQQWTSQYIAHRRHFYLQAAFSDRHAAEQAWLQEQKEFPWIFGHEELPLVIEGTESLE